MARARAHGGQWGAAETGAGVWHVHSCGGGSGWVQINVAVDGAHRAHRAHRAQTRIHAAGGGVHLQKRNSTCYAQQNPEQILIYEDKI